MVENLVKSIKEVNILKELNEEQLLKFAESCEVKSFKAGDVIIQAGELTENLCILIKGSCSVEIEIARDEKYFKDAKHFKVSLVKPGGVFGEMSFLGKIPRTATVICKEPCEVVMISRKGFDELKKREPEVGRIVWNNVIKYKYGKYRSYFL